VSALLRLLGDRPLRPLAGPAALGLLALLPIDGLGGAALRASALIGALALTARALRTPAQAERPLRVPDRQPLGRDNGLALVEVGKRRLLVGWSPAGLKLVADVSREVER